MVEIVHRHERNSMKADELSSSRKKRLIAQTSTRGWVFAPKGLPITAQGKRSATLGL
jgi:hypothetical protein